MAHRVMPNNEEMARRRTKNKMISATRGKEPKLKKCSRTLSEGNFYTQLKFSRQVFIRKEHNKL